MPLSPDERQDMIGRIQLLQQVKAEMERRNLIQQRGAMMQPAHAPESIPMASANPNMPPGWQQQPGKSTQELLEDIPPGNSFLGNIGRDLVRLPLQQAAFAEQIGSDPVGAVKGFGEFVLGGAKNIATMLAAGHPSSTLSEQQRKGKHITELGQQAYARPLETAIQTTAPLAIAKGVLAKIPKFRAKYGGIKELKQEVVKEIETRQSPESAIAKWDQEIGRQFKQKPTVAEPVGKAKILPDETVAAKALVETAKPEQPRTLEVPKVDPTDFNARFPVAKDVVDNRIVHGETPNQSSIPASLTDYDILPGIREVRMSEFEGLGKHYSVEGNKLIAELQQQISQSKELNPLIVVADAEGAYILEGATRADALANLGAKKMPAMVVIDKQIPPQRLAKPKPKPQETPDALQGKEVKATEGTKTLKEEPQAIPKAQEVVPPKALTKEAKQPWKMTREEFYVGRGKPALRPFSTSLGPKDLVKKQGSVYHGTSVGAALDIVKSGEIRPFMSRGEILGESVVSMTPYKKTAGDFGSIIIELKDRNYLQREGAFKGDQLKDLEVSSSIPVKFEDIKSVTIEIGASESLSWTDPISKMKLSDVKNAFESRGISVVVDKTLPHKGIIKQAISEGKPVPAEVLAEYPELAAKPKGRKTLKEEPQAIPKAQEVAPPKALTKEAKQPWEMTKGEWDNWLKTTHSWWKRLRDKRWAGKEALNRTGELLTQEFPEAVQKPLLLATHYARKWKLKKSLTVQWDKGVKKSSDPSGITTMSRDKYNVRIYVNHPHVQNKPGRVLAVLRHELEHVKDLDSGYRPPRFGKARDFNEVFREIEKSGRDVSWLDYTREMERGHHKDFPLFDMDYLRKKQIKQALSEGKPVPAEVLAEYPELKPSKPKGEKGKIVEMEAGGLSKVSDILDRQLTNDPATPIAKISKEGLTERAGQLAVKGHESSLFRERLKKVVPAKQREDMMFVRQKTANPYRKNDTFEAAEARLSPRAKTYLDKIDKRISKNWDDLVKEGIYADEAWVADYLHQAWDMPKKKAKQLAHGFITKPPKGRKVQSYFEGIVEKGYKPRFTDIAELLEYQENLLTQVKYNRRLATQLRKWKDPDTQQPLLMMASEKGVPEAYGMMDSPALARAVKPGYPVEGGWIAPRGISVAVHPEAYAAVKAMFGKPYHGKIGTAIDYFNAVAKKTALSISLFHHIALSESAGAIGKPVLGMLTAPVKALKGYKMLRDPAYYAEPLKAGLQVGSTGDLNLTKINRMLNTAVRKTRKVPVIRTGMKAIRGFNRLWDKALWDYYHNGLKMYYYYATKERILRNNPKMNPKLISEEVAKIMNDGFGGQAWDRMLMNPKVIQVLRRVFLAPDWTISNIRIAYRALESGKATETLAKTTGKTSEMAKELGQRASVRGQIGRKYAFNMALQYFLVIEGLNYAFTGHSTFENDPGHKWHIKLPTKFGKKNIYVTPFKQAREPFRYIFDAIESVENLPEEAYPPKILAYKLSPFIHTVTEQLTGATTTGWKKPWVARYPGQEIDKKQAWGERALSVGEKFIPFAARRVIPGVSRDPLPVGYAGLPMPVSTGMYKGKFIRLYRKAILTDDRRVMRELRESARDNGFKKKEIESWIKRAANSAKKKGN